MPKQRTHKSTAKRFRRTKGGKGKLVRTRMGKSHLRRKKSARAKRLFDEMVEVGSAGTEKRVRRLAPYLSEKGN
jgi:large subunit ribosomal protein L35